MNVSPTQGGAVWKRSLAVLTVLLLPLGHLSISDGAQDPDPCETEALKAYWQALKLCQLAEPRDPRLQCYEAAKAVYVQTLEHCRTGR
jgi:hypothetical protein